MFPLVSLLFFVKYWPNLGEIMEGRLLAWDSLRIQNAICLILYTTWKGSMAIATPISIGLSWPLYKSPPNLGVASHLLSPWCTWCPFDPLPQSRHHFFFHVSPPQNEHNKSPWRWMVGVDEVSLWGNFGQFSGAMGNIFQGVHPLSLTVSPWKMMVGRWLSFWVLVTFQGLC